MDCRLEVCRGQKKFCANILIFFRIIYYGGDITSVVGGLTLFWALNKSLGCFGIFMKIYHDTFWIYWSVLNLVF